jgi:hypothetical protein
MSYPLWGVYTQTQTNTHREKKEKTKIKGDHHALRLAEHQLPGIYLLSLGKNVRPTQSYPPSTTNAPYAEKKTQEREICASENGASPVAP